MHLTHSVEIAAPPSAVWDVLADLERWPEWTPTINAIEVIEGDALAPGLRARISQPAQRPAIWTVQRMDPGVSFAWGTRNMGMEMVGEHLLSPSGAGTRLTLVLDISGIGAVLLRPLLSLVIPKALRQEAEGLKRYAEERAEPAGPTYQI